MKNINRIFAILILCLSTTTFAFSLFGSDAAEKPAVVDEALPVNAQNNQNQAERQATYLEQLNIPERVEKMQQEIQELRGLVELQAHQVEQLEKQQRNLYADLDARLNDLSSSATKAVPVIAPKGQASFTNNEEESDKQMLMYQNAFNLIKSKKYSQAIKGLNNYLKKYPSGKYAANSHYWLGELYAKAGDSDKAIVEFNTIVNSYADSNKAPDAMLRLGSIAYDQSQWSEARKWWKKIVAKYPNIAAARVAETHLQELEQQGN